MKYFVAAFLAPFYWWIMLSLALWAIRKICPRWEGVLFAPLSVTVRGLWRRLTCRR